MSSTSDLTIWCDAYGCTEWAQGESGWLSARVRKSLYARGWTRVKLNGAMVDLCPEDSKREDQWTSLDR